MSDIFVVLMYAGVAACHGSFSGWELARALCPGFFLHECNPAPSAHPAGLAGLHASIGEPVAFACGTEFHHQALKPLTNKAARLMPITKARATPATAEQGGERHTKQGSNHVFA
jgi:hypothetical protein